MHTFEFCSMPRIVFGQGTHRNLGDLAAPLGNAALLVSNAGLPGDGGSIDCVDEVLRASGIQVTVFRQRGEPTVEDVERALSVARENQCDLVVGLGGGSAIDAAKAVAGLMTNGGSPLDYMEVIGRGQPMTKPAAPWIAVPTTAGTGAEVTRNAVIGSTANQFKASLRSEHLMARIAVIDAELAEPVPASVTARSGMDAICQLLESYTSCRAQPMTDALALEGLRHTAPALELAVENGEDLAARESMALGALLSGITLTNVGLGAVHGFAAPLGANFPIPHGTICAALLPHVVKANVVALRAIAPNHDWLARYEVIGRTLARDHTLRGPTAIEAGAEFLLGLVQRLRIPRLRDVQLPRTSFSEMVTLARRASSMRYNPVELSDEALHGILESAW